ncbi:NADH-quinone oxidoreductase subunit I [Marinisporobacter balticus]|uniref:4Fe-4S binding protein n=1 Tax=Marinisporobacter balticus TaxID=2018667 RepID=A0A4R2KGD6_9FIRM|nr:4Fe-4S dicluster domain-containing protein [Marinisporobacter balticus]TCO71462.1 4Fe-4S binding protein [Marinisporobacter balticus]
MDNKSLKTVGSPSLEELKNSPSFPREEDFLRGPIAVIECIEEIPCNPCQTACPKGAIFVGKPITNLPKIDFKKCMGCGICVAACPGLAIYIKDLTYSEQEVRISFPFEYLPLPNIGDVVDMVGRKGEEICKGRVTRINNGKANHNTVVISATYPKEYFQEVISMKRL